MLLNTKVFGEGTPLVLLHGLFGSLDNWTTVGRSLSEHYQVMLVDQRNHGTSFHHPEWGYKEMAQDLKDFLDAHSIDQAYILGHSMGGKTAMTFAFHFPELVRKLIIVDIAPKFYPPYHNEIIEALLSVNLSSISRRSEVDKLLSTDIPETGIRQFLLKGLVKQGETYRWKFNLAVISKKYLHICEGLDVPDQFHLPALFIRGEYSNYVTDEDWDQLRKNFMNVQLITVPDTGHWIHAESPKSFIEIVHTFLQRPTSS